MAGSKAEAFDLGPFPSTFLLDTFSSPEIDWSTEDKPNRGACD
jgi:hypothetical protein